MFYLFSDGDRACQPTGGGGGLRERGGAADVLHPACSASRRRRPHPCSVSFPYSFTRAHVALIHAVLIFVSLPHPLVQMYHTLLILLIAVFAFIV